MQTTNINDILFDDLSLINLLGYTSQPVTIPIMYGDCNNRYETAEDPGTDCDDSN